ncbi:DoxX family protein [Rudanella paleaurantiibacter]|uniref:DoxX family protein n=1 Tax=Rudanella paleaurantiibacter TaxID=2614655 RepID=A0A7J5TTA2_9BACT|nr:DoxX family protein [Rudanella paleaurantiibacter]KAB7727043.1 DoxX family protein [Rudanella paleaurantiibacter]
MKKTTIAYWVFTGLFCFVMAGSAIPNIMADTVSLNGFAELGYPAYLVPFLGWAKLLGVIALLIPGYPRLKEWAYAGLMFDILGAIYSIAAVGKPLSLWLPMFVLPLVGMLSYVYHHKRLNVQATKQTRAASPVLG